MDANEPAQTGPEGLSDLALILSAAQAIAGWLEQTSFMPPRIFSLGRGGAHLAPNIIEYLSVKPRLVYLSREFDFKQKQRATLVSSEGLDPNRWLEYALVVTGLVDTGQTWGEARQHLQRDLGIRDVRCATLWQGPTPSMSADFVFEHVELTKSTLERVWYYRINPPEWLPQDKSAT